MCNLLNCFVLYSGGSRISHGRGGGNSQCTYTSKNLYVQKELGPLRGVRTAGAPWIRQWYICHFATCMTEAVVMLAFHTSLQNIEKI